MIKKPTSFRSVLIVLVMLTGMGAAQASVTLNSTNFPDANFRNALSEITGVAVGGTINEATLTSLDVSGRGITNLTGLEKLTGLTYLDISDNSGLTTGANLTPLTALSTLKASNCNVRTLAGTYETYSSTRYAGLNIGSANSAIRYLDLSGNVRFFTSGNLQYLTNLETLLLRNCTYYDYWGYLPGNGMRSLKWVDVSGCPAMDRIYLRGATQLKHLNAEGTKVQGFTTNPQNNATTANFIVLSSNSPVEYINIGNCLVTNAGLNGITTYGVASLDTLIVKGNSSFGHSSCFDQLPSLTYLDISNCDIYFRTGYLLDHLTPSHNPNLETLLVNNSSLGSHTEGITGFTKLKTVDASGNPGIINFGVSGSPLLQTLNITGNTSITELKLNDDTLPRNDFNLIGANGNTPIPVESLYLNGNNYNSIRQATESYPWFSTTLAFLYLERNSGFPNGPLTLTAEDCGALTGIDLGNNGFTSFHAPSLPPTLTALMLGDNTSMKRLEMHNNPGITTMTSGTTMSDGSGLYLLGNTALTYMDISGTEETPNHFQRIGNNFSLENVPIDTLKASHNQFYTFRNLTTVSTRDGWEVWKNNQYGWVDYDGSSSPGSDYIYGFWPASPAQPDSASLEQLTRLEYLDLSYCHLKDSVHLHKNRELLYLDLSHNRVIHRYYEPRTPAKGAAYRAYNNPDDNTIDKRSFPDYKIYLWLKSNDATGLEEFTGDYNDTIGLYDLDLAYNHKLEYLDISYTGIEQTAARHCYVANARYVWIQDLPNLKYFYADYNGMRSLGITTKFGRFYQEGLKSLERLSVIGMRGSDDKTMKGSTNYASINPAVNPTPSPLVNLHYINLSYSSYDSIGIYNECVDTLIIRGNPIHYLNVQRLPLITYVDARESAFKMRGYDPETGRTYPPNVNRFKNGARLNGEYYASSTNEYIPILTPADSVPGRLTSVFSGLRAVRAHHRPKLTTLLLDSCNALKEVYAHHNPMLTKINGFEHLAYPKPEVDAQYHYSTDVDSLTLVWVNDNAIFNELNLTQNVNLKYLHAYNDPTLGDYLGSQGMQLDENVNLKTAWVSNSRLQAFGNNAGANLDTLYIWTNPKLDYLDVSENTGLKWFDLRNCRIRDLDVSYNGQLIEFDCSNDSIQGMTANAWGCPIPNAVPTSIDEDGKNSIADLHFASHSLTKVKADNNDLFCMDGLDNNPSLHTLTYNYNHINAIDLTGSNPTVYQNTHNGRGTFYGELSQWKEKDANNQAIDCSLYYLQLDSLANDGLVVNGIRNNTFLGDKAGQDTVLSISSDRVLTLDGFKSFKVDTFFVNSSGPHHGQRVVNQAPRRASMTYGADATPDPEKIIGDMVFLDKYEAEVPEGYNERYYIEYKYLDGRTDTSTSTFYLVWMAPPVATDVEETTEDGLAEATVVSERYFDISGNELNEPVASGITIIVRQMSDGSQQAVKIMK